MPATIRPLRFYFVIQSVDNSVQMLFSGDIIAKKSIHICSYNSKSKIMLISGENGEGYLHPQVYVCRICVPVEHC